MDIKDLLIKMIKAIEFFKNLSDEQALALSKDFALNIYQSGSHVIQEGTVPEKIFLLKNGKLEVGKSKGFDSVKLGEIKPGEIFGEMSYINKTRALASVVAVVPCDIWEIDIKKFDNFLKSNPDIKNDVVAVMKTREKMNEDKLKDMLHGAFGQDDLKILL